MSSNRETVIANSIAYSILNRDNDKQEILEKVSNLFKPHWITFNCVGSDLFRDLRSAWQITEDDYRKSFEGENALEGMADMGYSGSTFFRTSDSAYMVKSVPRHFEHSFFKDDLLEPYANYMQDNPSSLLVRITDFLECEQHTVGSALGTAPSHHIVMENIMYGQDAQRGDEGDGDGEWDSWDLKPMSYFYPERDVAGGALSSEETKSKLADGFEGSIVLDLDRAEELKAQLQKDTRLLEQCNAVDYSLFLIRIPATSAPDARDQPSLARGTSSNEPVPPAEPPFAPPSPPSWRTGVRSADGRYVYRASVLDFFWAKHKVHAMAMTGLINTYNVVDNKGPMSVTTTSDEYRKRFLKMCSEIISTQTDAMEQSS